ncbi:MAG: hypothetical protein K5686_09290 [Lachnospiraceae bacterium]|nr:hypothetical protein [Lachnospiraceae bacterium]
MDKWIVRRLVAWMMTLALLAGLVPEGLTLKAYAQEEENEESQSENRPSGRNEVMLSATAEGVKVEVEGDFGKEQDELTLYVSRVGAEQEEAAMEAVETERSASQNVAVSYTFDIKVLDREENECQPADESKVKIAFTLDEVSDGNLETNIYHIKDGAEKLEVETSEDTATAETDSFSLYTVEFCYNELKYVMNGDSVIPLSEILKSVGLNGEAEAVEVSNSELFSAKKEADGKWYVTANKPFTSTEWMKVTIEGVEYEIKVTDDNVIVGKTPDELREELESGWRFVWFTNSSNADQYCVPMNPGSSLSLSSLLDFYGIAPESGQSQIVGVTSNDQAVITAGTDSRGEWVLTPVADSRSASLSVVILGSGGGSLIGQLHTYTINVVTGSPYTGVVQRFGMEAPFRHYYVEVRGGGTFTLDEMIEKTADIPVSYEYPVTSDEVLIKTNACGKAYVTLCGAEDTGFIHYQDLYAREHSVWTFLIRPGGMGLYGSGTEADPYKVRNDEDWEYFADNINAGLYADKYYYFTGTINVTKSAGCYDASAPRPFSGHIEGDGCVLNVNIPDGGQYAAPFGMISGASIKQLIVQGSVNGGIHSAGLVGVAAGNGNLIDDCIINTAVTVTTGNNRHMGGIVGHATNSSITIRNTIFGGSLGNNGDYAGGFIGWCDTGADIDIQSCLFSGTLSDTENVRFSPVALRSRRTAVTASISNFYYTTEATLADADYLVTDEANASTLRPVVTEIPENVLYKEYTVNRVVYGIPLVTVYEKVNPAGLSSVIAYTGADQTAAFINGIVLSDALGTALSRDTDYTISMEYRLQQVDYEATTKVEEIGDYRLTFEPLGEVYKGGLTYEFSVANLDQPDIVIDSWKKLRNALAGGGEYRLEADVSPAAGDINSYLYVPVGITVTLDLNGHSIDRKLNHGNMTDLYTDTDAVKDGFVLKVDGNLTIEDTSAEQGGKICGGNNNDNGGGIYVKGSFTLKGGSVCANHSDKDGGGIYNKGTLLIQGGSVSGNTAELAGGIYASGEGLTLEDGSIDNNLARYGAGLLIYGDYFTMTGGIITQNHGISGMKGIRNGERYLRGSEGGAAVARCDHFEMSGGKICDNTASAGAGIVLLNHLDEEYSFSGDILISGNKNEDGSDSNLIFDSWNGLYPVMNITAPLSETALIGVTGQPYGAPVTEGLAGRGSLDNFFSDDPGYTLKIADGEVWNELHKAMITKIPSTTGLEKVRNFYLEARDYNNDPYYHYRIGLYYNNMEQELLLDPGMAFNGTMLYGLGTEDAPPEDSEFHDYIPKAKWVGAYYIWYKAKSRDGIDTEIGGPIRVDIAPIIQKDHYYKSLILEPGKTYDLGELLAPRGINGEIKNVSLPLNRIGAAITKADNGSWLLTAPAEMGLIRVVAEMEDGYLFATDLNVDDKRPYINLKVVIYPNYPVGGNEREEIEIDDTYVLPEPVCEGWRFVKYTSLLGEDFYPGDVLTKVMAYYDTVEGFVFERGLYGEWEKVEEKPKLTEVLTPVSDGETAYLGGREWKKIGEGNGKKLYLDKTVSDGLYNADETEKAAMCKTYYSLTDGDYWFEYAHDNVFDLSFVEAAYFMPETEDRKAERQWALVWYENMWTDLYDIYIAVYPNGVFNGSFRTAPGAGHRSAFVLDESKIVLKSGAKPLADGSFKAFSAGGSASKKLTLLDETRSLSANLPEGLLLNPGGNVKIAYESAVTAEDEYVSCMLLDAGGNIIYYASHAVDGETDGVWETVLPDSLAAGDYTLRVFNEKRRGERESDHAGGINDFPVKISSVQAVKLGVSNYAELVYGDSVKLDVSAPGQVSFSSSDEAVAVIDDEGTVTAKGIGRACIIVNYEDESSAGREKVEIIVVPKPVVVEFENNGFPNSNWGKEYNPQMTVKDGILPGDECDARYKHDFWYGSFEKIVYKFPLSEAWLTNPNYCIANSDETLLFCWGDRLLSLRWEDTEFTYDGEEHVPSVYAAGFEFDSDSYDTGAPDERELTASGRQIHAGSYTATAEARYSEDFMRQYPLIRYAELAPSAYEEYILPEEKTADFRILPKRVSIKALQTAFVYDGTPKLPVTEVLGLVENDECTVLMEKIEKQTAEGNWELTGEAVEAGIYRATVTGLSNTDYVSDEEGKIIEFSVTDENLPFDGSRIIYTSGDHIGIYDGNPHSISLNVISPAGAVVRYGTEEGNYVLDEAPSRTHAGYSVVYYSITAEGLNEVRGSRIIDIRRRPVTVSGITAEDKVYDGNVDVNFAYDAVLLEGKLDEDELSVRAEGELSKPNAGADRQVDIQQLTLYGRDKDNYELAPIFKQQKTTAITVEKAESFIYLREGCDNVTLECESEYTILNWISTSPARMSVEKVQTGGLTFYGQLCCKSWAEGESELVLRTQESANYRASEPVTIHVKAVKASCDAVINNLVILKKGAELDLYTLVSDEYRDDVAFEMVSMENGGNSFDGRIFTASGETGEYVFKCTINATASRKGKEATVNIFVSEQGYGKLMVRQEGCTYGEVLPKPYYRIDKLNAVPDKGVTHYYGTTRSGAVYDSELPPTEAGTYYLDLAYYHEANGTWYYGRTKDNKGYFGSDHFEIKPVDISGRAVVTLGEQLSYTGTVQNQSISSVMLGNTDITESCYLENGIVTDAGEYTYRVYAMYDSNYCGYVTGSFTVAKKNITPAVSVKGSYSFSGSEVIPELAVRESAAEGAVLLKASDYELSQEDNINAGTAKLTVRPAAGGNYSFEPVTVEYEIAKADVPVLGDIQWIRSAGARRLNGSASGALPADAGNCSYAKAGDPQIIKAAGSSLSISAYTLDAASGLISLDVRGAADGDRISLPLMISSTNYRDTAINIVISIRNLADAGVSIQEGIGITKLYADADFTLHAVAAQNGGNGSFCWNSSDTSVAEVNDAGIVSIKGTGSTRLTAEYTSATHAGSADIVLTVNRQPLEIVWSDTLFIHDGLSHKPAAVISGLRDGDDCSVIVTGEGSNVGNYMATAELSGAKADNYILPQDKKNCRFSIRLAGAPDCEHIHTVCKNAVEASCVAKGYTGDTYCEDCGGLLEKGVETDIDPDKHHYGEAVVTLPATVITEGELEYRCTLCGHVHKEKLARIDDGEDHSLMLSDLSETDGRLLAEAYYVKNADGSTEITITVNGKPIEKTVTDKDGVKTVETYIWVGGLKESYSYTGENIKPEVHVYDGFKTLNENTDYSVSYRKNKKPGTAEAELKFKGRYKGSTSRKFKFEIRAAVLGSEVLAEDMAAAVSKKTVKAQPEMSFAESGKSIPAGNFKYEYYRDGVKLDGISEAGEYVVKISPANAYFSGTAEAKLSVLADKGRLLSKAAVSFDKKKYVYTGQPVIPAVSVKLGGSELKEGADFNISFVNNTEPGKATAFIRAVSGNAAGYAGSKKMSFTITKGRELKQGKGFSFSYDTTVPYVKSGAKPALVVKDGEVLLKEGSDYALSYAKNKSLGDKAFITVKGKGKYKGSVKLGYTIVKQNLESLSANIIADDKPESDKGYKDPELFIFDKDGKRLKSGRDYRLESDYNGPDENGMITVSVSGAGNYEGRVKVSYRYIKAGTHIGRLKCKKATAKDYTGRPVTLSDKELSELIYDGGRALSAGRDLVAVGYINNTDKGTAKAAVRGIGVYGGVRMISFKIKARKADCEGVLVNGVWK